MNSRSFFGKSDHDTTRMYQEYAMAALIEKDAEKLTQLANSRSFDPEDLAANAVHSLKMLKILTAKNCPHGPNFALTLKLAIEGQYFDSAKYLIDRLVESRANTPHGLSKQDSMGIYSSAALNPDILDYLLPKNIKSDYPSDDLNAAFAVAVAAHSIRSVRSIIAAMSKLNLASKKTFHAATFVKALKFACDKLNTGMVNELIPCVTDEEDLSDVLIHLASTSRFSSDKILNMKLVEELIIIAGVLIGAGANPNRRGLEGTAIERAGQHPTLAPLLNYLIKANSHLTAATSSTATASTPTNNASLVAKGGLFSGNHVDGGIAPIIVQPANAMREIEKVIAPADDGQYNLEIHPDYHKFLKSFIDDLNKKVKDKNRHILPRAKLDELAESHPHLCCEISFEIPDVPVDLGGHLFDLPHLLQLLAINNGRARVPWGNNDAETFTIKDIRAAKAKQDEILALRKPFEKSSQFALEKEASEYYNLCIHKDYNSFTASYFEWLNGTNDGKNKKQKNSARLTAAQKTAIEADPKNARMLSVLSGKLPDVPVKLADYVYDLSELLELLRKNNGSAVVPYPAGETETFELADIDSGMEIFKQMNALIGQVQAAKTVCVEVQALAPVQVAVQMPVPAHEPAKAADSQILHEAVRSLIPEKVEALLSSNQYDKKKLDTTLRLLFNAYALNDYFEVPGWWGKEEIKEREQVTINIAKQLLKAGASFTLSILKEAYELTVVKHFPGISEFLISEAEINHTNLEDFCKLAIWDKNALEILIRIKSPTKMQLMTTYSEAISKENETTLDSIKLLLNHVKDPMWLNVKLVQLAKNTDFQQKQPEAYQIKAHQSFIAKVAKLLIDAGADPYARDNFGGTHLSLFGGTHLETVLEIAARNHLGELVTVITMARQNYSPSMTFMQRP